MKVPDVTPTPTMGASPLHRSGERPRTSRQKNSGRRGDCEGDGKGGDKRSGCSPSEQSKREWRLFARGCAAGTEQEGVRLGGTPRAVGDGTERERRSYLGRELTVAASLKFEKGVYRTAAKLLEIRCLQNVSQIGYLRTTFSTRSSTKSITLLRLIFTPDGWALVFRMPSF